MKKFLLAAVSVFTLVFAGCSVSDEESDFFAAGKNSLTFTVSFDANGGSGYMKGQEFRIGVPEELLDNAFTAPTSEYKFSCWNTKADGTGVDYKQGDEFEIQSSDVTLYAKWIPKRSYSIVYRNLFYTTHSNAFSYVVTDTVTLLSPSERTGYAFDGWYTTNSFDEGSKIEGWNRDEKTGSITVYAKWNIITYSILYNLDEGTNSDNNPSTYNFESETITFEAPNKTGYEFLGWYTNSDFDDDKKNDKIVTNSTGNVELWAKWKIKNYNITFKDSNNTQQDYYQTFYYHEQKALTENSFTIPVGFIFKGWSLNNSSDVDYEDTEVYTMEDSDINLYTVWEEKPAHNISYLNVLTAGNPNTATYREKDTVTLQNLSLDNYKFVGWFLNDEGDAITSWAPGTYSEDISLSARWTYPDTLKCAGTFAYACGNIPLSYTITLQSLGTTLATRYYSSGDNSENLEFHLDGIDRKYIANGVVWTATMTATNAEHGLYYSSSASSTVSDGNIKIVFPKMAQRQ